MYSLDDLAIAQQKFDYWADLWSKEYLENKPNIYDAEAKKASEHLREVEEYLKLNGIIPFTDDKLAQNPLNELYPSAKSREIVTYNGTRYQKRFFPKKRSESGKTVKEWYSTWVNLDSQL